MAITQAKIKQAKLKKPLIVSYEIPDSFNPFATGEQLIRLESELKNQRELMKQGFEDMNKRFESELKNQRELMQQGFEDMNQRLESELKNQRELMQQGFEDMNQRLESELKNQRELMQQGFESMNKRFEDMQKNSNKRFYTMLWVLVMGGGFTITFRVLTFLMN